MADRYRVVHVKDIYTVVDNPDSNVGEGFEDFAKAKEFCDDSSTSLGSQKLVLDYGEPSEKSGWVVYFETRSS